MRCLHRIHGIADQVEEHLLNLNAVRQHQVDSRIKPELNPDSAVFHAHQSQRAGLFDELGDAFHPPLAFAARHKIAKPADNLAGTHGLVGGFLQRITHHRGFFIAVAFEQPL